MESPAAEVAFAPSTDELERSTISMAVDTRSHVDVCLPSVLSLLHASRTFFARRIALSFHDATEDTSTDKVALPPRDRFRRACR